MLLRIFLFLLIAAALMANATMGSSCSCIAIAPEREATLIKEASAIVALEVLESEITRGQMEDGLFLPAKVKLIQVYKGDLQDEQELTIWSEAYGSCTHSLGAGDKVDLLLFF